MTDTTGTISLVSSVEGNAPGVHRFTHDAMGTTFGISVIGSDPEYDRQASAAAFEELDRLEGELSRFIETSDVYRVSHAPATEPQIVGLDLIECLEVASAVGVATGGAFDITVGALMPLWVGPNGERRTPSDEELDAVRKRTGMGLVVIDDEARAVALAIDGMRLDLGGIGKGYALDCMAAILKDWDVENALLHSGESTVVALSSPWRLALRDPRDQRGVLASVSLSNCAMAGSGVHVRGAHVLDPRTGKPVTGREAAWSVAATAVAADALSTAFMVMSDAQVRAYCDQHAGDCAILIPLQCERPEPTFIGVREGFEFGSTEAG